MITIITGRAGSGKTSKALSFLRLFSESKRVLYITNQTFSVRGKEADFLNRKDLKVAIKIVGDLKGLDKLVDEFRPDIIIIDNLTCLTNDIKKTMKTLQKHERKDIDIYYTVQTDVNGKCKDQEDLFFGDKINISHKRK